MLCNISIQNYALIEQLEMQFSAGTNIITGETGAGKSILLGALSLVLGQRADTNVLYYKEKKCIVEAHFDVKGYKMQDIFESKDIDYEETCIIRREIHPNGRSRAFVNDTPVTNQVLKELTSGIIDIHSQHHSLSLVNRDFQLEVVDDFAGSHALLDSYKALYKSYMAHKKELKELIEKSTEAAGDADYYNFLLNELEAAQIKENEQDDIEKELLWLNNTEDIKLKLSAALQALNNEPHNLLLVLKEISDNLRSTSAYLPALQELYERTESAYIEIKDIARDLEQQEEKVIYSPERLDELNERINLIYSLQKKHRVSTTAELLQKQEEVAEKIQHIDSLDKEIKKFEALIIAEEKELSSIAAQLSEKRHAVLSALEKRITDLLKELAMPQARFIIDCHSTKELTASGKDTVLFRFSANKGKEAEDMAKIASGGELSRLMLAVKSVVSASKLLPVLIFDEIDTGISGEAAVKTGKMLLEMSKNMQIVAITHLPQIARLGKTHYEVYKEDVGDKTQTYVKKLSQQERVQSIASMISGAEITQTAQLAAKELLES